MPKEIRKGRLDQYGPELFEVGMLNSFFFQIRTSFLKFEFYSNFVQAQSKN